MIHAQAQYPVDNGATARVEIRGEDTVYDNREGAQGGPARDLGQVHRLRPDPVMRQVLDAGDGIHTKIIVGVPGYPKTTKRSNVVHGSYGLFGTDPRSRPVGYAAEVVRRCGSAVGSITCAGSRSVRTAGNSAVFEARCVLPITPAGKYKGRHPMVASVYRALAEAEPLPTTDTAAGAESGHQQVPHGGRKSSRPVWDWPPAAISLRVTM